ncbi:hypothetical protein AMECASPLE_028986 [Ameca splendens]|uniref:Uncharacterized protein n=1 Tax=Ameca splendens TaxID=208324 RepID=A0ABV0ZFJ2_9TELE
MYEIDWRTQSCRKLPLEAYFMPMHVPADAILIGQAVLGSSSSWGMGLLTNTWGGQFQNKDTYSSVFTEIGCLPVTLTSYSPKSGWTTISTYNRVIGLSNPMDFILPSFCDAAEIEKSAKPHTVFSAMESLAGHEGEICGVSTRTFLHSIISIIYVTGKKILSWNYFPLCCIE